MQIENARSLTTESKSIHLFNVTWIEIHLKNSIKIILRKCSFLNCIIDIIILIVFHTFFTFWIRMHWNYTYMWRMYIFTNFNEFDRCFIQLKRFWLSFYGQSFKYRVEFFYFSLSSYFLLFFLLLCGFYSIQESFSCFFFIFQFITIFCGFSFAKENIKCEIVYKIINSF